MRRRCRQQQISRRSPAGTHRLEPLEPRVLLSFYAGATVPDLYGLNEPIHDFVVPAVVDGSEVAGFGAAAANLGDIDGDGRADFAVTAAGRAAAGGDEGAQGLVLLYSGASGDLIRVLRDGFHEFGAALANVGDLDGDGVADLMVGSPRFATDALPGGVVGRVSVFSGADGAELWSVTGVGPADELGRSVALLGDTNGDGVAEVAAGAPGAGPDGEGRAFIYSGVDGAALVTLTGMAAGDRFGQAVAAWPSPGAGTAANPADGVADLVVGMPGADFSETVLDSGGYTVWSGADGSLVSEQRSQVENAAAGSALAVLRTPLVSDAGAIQLVVGAPGWSGATPSGGLFIDSAANEGLYFPTVTPEAGYTGLGSAISNIGDIDGDGRDDLAAVMVSPEGERRVLFWSPRGSFGTLITVPQEPEPPNYIYASTLIPGVLSIAAGGDLDGDGVPDVATAGVDEDGALRVRVLPGTAVAGVQPIAGWSDSLEYLFAQAQSVYYGGRGWATGYLIVGGRFTPLSQVPGLGDVHISGVNDSGLIVGYELNPSYGGPDLTRPFIYADGVRTPLAEAVTTITGPTDIDFSGVSFVDVGNGGEVLLLESRPWMGLENPASVSRAWVYKDGRLRFLWLGTPTQVNDAGTVLGTSWPLPYAIGATRLWSEAEGAREVGSIWNATAINNNGFIVGTDAQNDLAIWNGERVREIADEVWRPVGIDDDGTVLAQRHDQTGLRLALVVQGGPVRPLEDAIVGRAEPLGALYGPSMTTSGDIIAGTRDEQIILSKLEPAEGFGAAPGSPTGAAAGRYGVVVTAFNAFGVPVTLRLVEDPGPGGARWEGRSLSPLELGGVAAADVSAYTDPKDGRAYVVVSSPGSLVVAAQLEDGSYGEVRELSPDDLEGALIEGALTTFVGADGLARIAGRNSLGELLLYEQTGEREDPRDDDSPFLWRFTNVSRADLAPNGEAAPAWVGEITTLVTPWNGLTLAGLDASGDIRIVWWAPGRTRWATENLSETAAAPALTGRLAPYVTPWGGMNIAGTELGTGELSVTWWVPSFGPRWENNLLTEETGGPRLAPESLVAFVTPWGTLHVAGNDADTGAAVIYWWAADLGWMDEAFPLRNELEAPRPVADLVPLVSGTNLNLFGRAESGEIVRLFWNPPDGALWNIENLTAQVGPPAG